MKFFIETLGTYSSIVLLTIYDIKKNRFFESSKPIFPLNDHFIAWKMISKLNLIKILVYFSALQCKKVQSSIEKFHWSKKLRNTESFSFYLNKSSAWKRQLISTCFFVSSCHFDNGTVHKVTHNFHLKIRSILELTTCPV